MIVDNPSDMKQCSLFQSADKEHEVVGLVCITLQFLRVRIEQIGSIKRINERLLQVAVSGIAEKIVGGKSGGFLLYHGNRLRFPLFHAAIVADDISPYARKHSFGQNSPDQTGDILFPFVIVNLGAIINRTGVALLQCVLVQIVLALYLLCCDLKILLCITLIFSCLTFVFFPSCRMPFGFSVGISFCAGQDSGRRPTRQGNSRLGAMEYPNLRFAEGCRCPAAN